MTYENFDCPVCLEAKIVKVLDNFSYRDIIIPTFTFSCDSCTHSWLPHKEEARIDLEVRNQLAAQVDNLREELKQVQTIGVEMQREVNRKLSEENKILREQRNDMLNSTGYDYYDKLKELDKELQDKLRGK